MTQESVDQKLAYAEMYLSGGWKIFIVRETKVTFPQCNPCRDAGHDHDREACPHLLCHGFYAATSNIDTIRAMLTAYPAGLLALRTGRASRVFALDFESHSDSPELPSGTEVLDAWEQYVGFELPLSLTARSQSGGIHRLFRTNERVGGRTRVLPSTDVKAEGGYVVLPPAPGREWLSTRLDDAPPLLLDWLRERRGTKSSAWVSRTTGQRVGHAAGYDFQLFLREGCPGGYRDDFINDLLFRLRKAGKSPQEAWQVAYDAWRRVAQPPYAKYHMPFAHVEYKLRRVWQTVGPDEIPDVVRGWVAQARRERDGGSDASGGWHADADGNTVKKVGRTTIVRRQS